MTSKILTLLMEKKRIYIHLSKGGLIVVYFGNTSQKQLGHLLSFSAGVMIYLSFLDLLPEAVEKLGFIKANLGFFLGILFFCIVDWLLPTGEHSHAVPKSSKKGKKGDKTSPPKQENPPQQKKKDLYRLGVLSALSISLHNFPEGLAVYLASVQGLELGLPIALGIAAHNIPEGMAVASPIYHTSRSRTKALFWCFISGVCEPVAALIFGLFASQYITEEIVFFLLAGVAGIMLVVSLKELFPTALEFLKSEQALFSNVIGMLFMSVSIYFLHGDHSHGHSHGGQTHDDHDHHDHDHHDHDHHIH
jgi:ZIP family zinc transporter